MVLPISSTKWGRRSRQEQRKFPPCQLSHLTTMTIERTALMILDQRCVWSIPQLYYIVVWLLGVNPLVVHWWGTYPPQKQPRIKPPRCSANGVGLGKGVFVWGCLYLLEQKYIYCWILGCVCLHQRFCNGPNCSVDWSVIQPLCILIMQKTTLGWTLFVTSMSKSIGSNSDLEKKIDWKTLLTKCDFWFPYCSKQDQLSILGVHPNTTLNCRFYDSFVFVYFFQKCWCFPFGRKWVHDLWGARVCR